MRDNHCGTKRSRVVQSHAFTRLDDSAGMKVPRSVEITMTEMQLQSAVLEIATQLGWLHYHTYRSDRSDKGFPDLVLVHPDKERVVWVECKTGKGIVSPEQTLWHDNLAACDCEVYVIRPAHLDSGEVADILMLNCKPSKVARVHFDSSVVRV